MAMESTMDEQWASRHRRHRPRYRRRRRPSRSKVENKMLVMLIVLLVLTKRHHVEVELYRRSFSHLHDLLVQSRDLNLYAAISTPTNVGVSFRREESIGANCWKWVLVGRQAAYTEPVFVRLAGTSGSTVESGC
ncbi:hypothetical protein [Absidia glauca]|uniref:Uncharacterized protein n=1 Tax=Absidia glauca TaxID=4829 RepID=A0A163JSJ7_ABSGL|nr:hypothetical protein [Absidia glauca]